MSIIKFIRIMLLLFCLFLVGCKSGEKVEFSSEEDICNEKDSNNDRKTESNNGDLEEIAVVYVCGAVSYPGVYEICENSRVSDAVAAAGGFVSEADTESVNLAAVIEDGVKIRIPYKGEASSPSDNTSEISSGTDAGKININKATKEQLMTLSGVGESKADAIIKYRDTNGPFKSVEDIMNIEGIKEGVFNKIKDDIFVK